MSANALGKLSTLVLSLGIAILLVRVPAVAQGEGQSLHVFVGKSVIINLQAPRERFFGRLIDIATYGVTVRGIDLNAFEDWMAHVLHREESGVQPNTVFFPIHRIEKIIMDEGIGALPSFSDTFLTKVGQAVEQYLE